MAERVLSSWVLAGIWCDVPEFCAPWAAARPAGQILRPVESAEGGGLRSTLTFCPAVKEKEEEGPRRGSVPLPELCRGQTPTLTGKDRRKQSLMGISKRQVKIEQVKYHRSRSSR